MKLKLLSLGNNRKLAENIPIFNLPAGITCPGKTKVCGKICYAARSERLYAGARAMRARNLIASRSPGFVEDICTELSWLQNSKGVTLSRVHESGDYYCQRYLDKWIHITSLFPKITFLAYTKSVHLDFSKAPPNLRLYVSMDTSSDIRNMYSSLNHTPEAWIVLKGDTPPVGLPTCIHADKDKHYCGSACKICWEGSHKDYTDGVYFLQH